MKERRFTILWQGLAFTASWIVRAVLALFSVVLMVLGIAALTSAVLGYTPSWLPNRSLTDPNLIEALSSLLLGFAGLYIGTRLRKYQEMEAEARAKLALNVELRTRVVLAGDRCILEVIIDVHNVSRTTWFVPMAYLFVRSAFGDEEVPLGREFNNIAKYPATLCQLQPDERDQFFATVTFSQEQSRNLAAVVVSAEVVGTAGKWLAPRTAMMEFIVFMEEDEGSRHKYLCIGRCANRGDKKLYGRRCFLKPNFSVDDGPTEDYRGLLDDIMMWSRERVVALVGPSSELGRDEGEVPVLASLTSLSRVGKETYGTEVT